jgi:hypothetical protein
MRKCGIDDVKLFQKVMNDVQISVVSKEHFNGTSELSNTKCSYYCRASSISFSNVSVDNSATFINGIVIGKSNSRHWTGILTRSSGLINSAKSFIKDLNNNPSIFKIFGKSRTSNYKYANLDRFLSEKQCIIRIQNRDELCCARALVTEKARLNKTENGDGIRKGYTIRALHYHIYVHHWSNLYKSYSTLHHICDLTCASSCLLFDYIAYICNMTCRLKRRLDLLCRLQSLF